MDIPATGSAVEVAYWFLDRATKDKKKLESDKLQHLLFLAQALFSSGDKNTPVLMPATFVCCKEGFVEPNVDKILELGKPLFSKHNFDKKIELFLETIWKKYSELSAIQIANVLKSHKFYKENYVAGEKNIVHLKYMVENFSGNSNIKKNEDTDKKEEKKMLLSQNGPVLVSKWKPRKI